MKKEISLSEFEEITESKIELSDSYLKIDNKKVDYESIISHRYLGMHDHVYSSNTKALSDLLLENWGFIIIELEKAIENYEVENEN